MVLRFRLVPKSKQTPRQNVLEAKWNFKATVLNQIALCVLAWPAKGRYTQHGAVPPTRCASNPSYILASRPEGSCCLWSLNLKVIKNKTDETNHAFFRTETKSKLYRCRIRNFDFNAHASFVLRSALDTPRGADTLVTNEYKGYAKQHQQQPTGYNILRNV